MFNTRFTCVKLLDVTRDFDLAERCSSALQTQYRYALPLEYNSGTILLNHNTNVVLLAGLHNMLTTTMLGIPSTGRE